LQPLPSSPALAFLVEQELLAGAFTGRREAGLVTAISLHQVGHRYGKRVALQPLNLEVEEGSILGFLGPNGAGKTTTIRILMGFLRPSQGQAKILGLDCWKQSALVKKVVGYLPGDLRLYSWMTADNGLDLLSKLHGRDLRKQAAPLCERFRLDPGLRVREMSRGMRQQLGLILALAARPRLLILDEPTIALDPLMQEQLLGYLKELAASGHTVLFSSHSLTEVERICDRVAILREGRLLADESILALRGRREREVRLTFAESTPVALPACLRLQERLGAVWRCVLQGPIAELTAWLATQPLLDVTIEQPDLESIFREFYL